MKKIKDLIQNALQNNENINSTLNSLSDIQNNLIKNYSNPVFNSKDKNKLIEMYNTVSDLGNSIYKIDSFQKNNMLTEADKENRNISDTFLKGGISNVKYIWHSENGEHTCEKCKALDGTTYDFEDEVPQRPHPNCKCHVEIVQDNINKKQETCDCIEQIDELITELEDTISKAENLTNIIESDMNELNDNSAKVTNMILETENTLESLKQEYGKHLPDCENNIDKQYGEIYATKAEFQTLLRDIIGLLVPLFTLLNVVRIFVSNYIALLYEAFYLKEAGMDKYRHSKANCEAAQQSGILGSKIATGLSDLKEYYDQFTYVHTHKVTLEEAIADSERDQVANRLGRERGRKYPYCSCSILMNDLKPTGKR